MRKIKLSENPILEFRILENTGSRLSWPIPKLEEVAKKSPYFSNIFGENIALMKVTFGNDSKSFFGTLLVQNTTIPLKFEIDEKSSVLKGDNFFTCFGNGCFQKHLLEALKLESSDQYILSLEVVWHTKWPEEIFPTDKELLKMLPDKPDITYGTLTLL